jgi:hypothetical protein
MRTTEEIEKKNALQSQKTLSPELISLLETKEISKLKNAFGKTFIELALEHCIFTLDDFSRLTEKYLGNFFIINFVEN